MTKIITMYNNKGGVSKTTTLFNLGVYLARTNKKVLFADCDPQCNLTELFFASNDVYDDPDTELPGTSIYQALLPRFTGETSSVDASKVELVQSTLYPHLRILRGDLEFSNAETYLGTSWNQAITENVHEKNTYVAVHRLLKALGALHDFEYILCDVGPSTGAITRSIVLACDGFLLPLIPDRFCNQAVKVLGYVVRQWVSRHTDICKTFAPFKIPTFPGRPVLLGAIIQNFKIHTAAKAKQSYVKWQSRISQNIREYLLGKEGLEAGPGCDPKNPYIATIRDVGPLAPVAQMFGRAIFDIRQEHTKEASTTGQMYYGSVWQPWKDRMDEYQGEIQKIAGVLP